MDKTRYYCQGCARIMECPRAFKVESCDSYIRASFYPCHRCKNFGGACRDSGLVECNFTPRATWNPNEILNKKLEEIENEKKG